MNLRDQYWASYLLASSFMIRMLGHSVPSATLLLIQNCEGWLIISVLYAAIQRNLDQLEMSREELSRAQEREL